MVSDKIFKVFKIFSVLLPWQPQFLTESIFFNKFWRGPCQEHFCEISPKSDEQFQRTGCIKEKLTHAQTDAHMDGRTTDNGPWHKLAGLWPMKQKIKALCLQVSEEKIFKVFLLCSYAQTCYPTRWGQFWPYGHNLKKLGRGPFGNATYQIPKLYAF